MSQRGPSVGGIRAEEAVAGSEAGGDHMRLWNELAKTEEEDRVFKQGQVEEVELAGTESRSEKHRDTFKTSSFV